MLEDTAGGTRWKRRGSPRERWRGAVKRFEEFGAQAHTVGRGRVAEDAAVALARAPRLPHRRAQPSQPAGEIDVVAEDGEVLCFVEVKARAGDPSGRRWRAVGPRKRRRLARAAALYLALRGARPACRFDVLAMEAQGDAGERSWRFSLIEDAFRLE